MAAPVQEIRRAREGITWPSEGPPRRPAAQGIRRAREGTKWPPRWT